MVLATTGPDVKEFMQGLQSDLLDAACAVADVSGRCASRVAFPSCNRCEVRPCIALIATLNMRDPFSEKPFLFALNCSSLSIICHHSRILNKQGLSPAECPNPSFDQMNKKSEVT